MASIFGHALAGFTIKKLVSSKQNTALLLLTIISAMLPDIDVLAFNFGIPYTHPLGHRGFTHSILFAVLWALVCVLFFKHKYVAFITVFLATLSHGLLDAITTGGKGVGFFIPFYDERFFLPWRIIKVSPIGIENFFSEWGKRVLLSELKYIALPCCIVLLTLYIKRKYLR